MTYAILISTTDGAALRQLRQLAHAGETLLGEDPASAVIRWKDFQEQRGLLESLGAIVGLLELRDVAIGVFSGLLSTWIWTVFCQPRFDADPMQETANQAPPASPKVVVEIEAGQKKVTLELGCTPEQIEVQIRDAMQK